MCFRETESRKAKSSTITARIARFMIPHVRKRRLTMERFQPDIDARPVFQKDMPEHFPEWVPRIEVPKHGGTVTHVVCDNAETLVYIANQGCLTPHVGLQRMDKNEYPDQMIFDLDPPSDDFGPVRTVAFKMRELLDEIGLISFPENDGIARTASRDPARPEAAVRRCPGHCAQDRGRDGPARTEPRHDRNAQEEPRRASCSSTRIATGRRRPRYRPSRSAPRMARRSRCRSRGRNWKTRG